ncbi:MAG: hypothetical protein PHG90_05575, partial [Clostridia bacterium]|nr:hypothetical protein [Clostridia bacterium]
MYKKLYAIPLNEIEIKKLNKISDYSKNQIKKEFEELIKNNQLFSKPNITSFQKPINQIKALCLHICH